MVNLVAACLKCNRIKSDLSLDDFRNKLNILYGIKVVFFYEKYGISIEKDGVIFHNSLNEPSFYHG